MIKLMQHPELKDVIGDPSFMQKIQVMMQNPKMADIMIQQDPKLKKAWDVLSS